MFSYNYSPIIIHYNSTIKNNNKLKDSFDSSGEDSIIKAESVKNLLKWLNLFRARKILSTNKNYSLFAVQVPFYTPTKLLSENIWCSFIMSSPSIYSWRHNLIPNGSKCFYDLLKYTLNFLITFNKLNFNISNRPGLTDVVLSFRYIIR